MRQAKHENTTKNIWQVADGDGERHYSKVFFDYGVMLIGGGWLGDYRKRNERGTEEWKTYKDPTNRKFIGQFFEAGIGELVVLKRGLEAIAVGEILGDYDFKEVFSDVEGFDLRHCRRVKWTKLEANNIDGLTQVRFCSVKKACHEVERLWEKNKRKGSAQKNLLKIPRNPARVKLVDSLAVKVWGRSNAKRIADEIERLQHLAEWYEDHDVKEHEARTFLIVPLIMSLGWDEKRVKIEWKHKDVALFNAPYSEKNEPIIIIESKRLWDGLGDAPEQAESYTRQHKACRQFVVSDGIRYKLFSKPKHARKFRFSAYLNLRTPTLKHPYERGVKGAVSFLLKMRPGAAI